MQEYREPETLALKREFFTAASQADVVAKMDARKAELAATGATQFRRVKIGRNAACPCGSGRKFKKCCIDKAV